MVMTGSAEESATTPLREIWNLGFDLDLAAW